MGTDLIRQSRQEHKPHTPSSIVRLRPNGEVTIIRK